MSRYTNRTLSGASRRPSLLRLHWNSRAHRKGKGWGKPATRSRTATFSPKWAARLKALVASSGLIDAGALDSEAAALLARIRQVASAP